MTKGDAMESLASATGIAVGIAVVCLLGFIETGWPRAVTTIRNLAERSGGRLFLVHNMKVCLLITNKENHQIKPCVGVLRPHTKCLNPL